MSLPRLGQSTNPDPWDDTLDQDWLGAEAIVRHRKGRRSPLEKLRLTGLMLVSLGFSVGFVAGAVAWCGMKQMFGKGTDQNKKPE
jgi:hypothetical protein